MKDPQSIDRLFKTESFTAQRISDGKRILIRGRRLRNEQYAGDLFPVVITVEHTYEVLETDGVPTRPQHAEYREVILSVIDRIEEVRAGIQVYADTTDGLVREWFYVSDAKATAKIIKEYAPHDFIYEMYSDDDPEWSFLEQMISQIRPQDGQW